MVLKSFETSTENGTSSRYKGLLIEKEILTFSKQVSPLKQFSEDEAKARRLYKAFVDEGLTSKENLFESLQD